MNLENKGINGKTNKGTQTKQSADKTSGKFDERPRQNLPLPRDISNGVRGPITTFEFCQVIQPTHEACGLTIVHKQITEEEIEPENSEIKKKRYRYCKEILKPYLNNYPPDCPDLTENFIKNSIETADEETPDQQPCFTFEGFKISGLDPIDLLRDNSEGSKTSKNKLESPEDTKVSVDLKVTEDPKNPKNNEDLKDNKDSKDSKQLKYTKDNTSAKTESQISKNFTDSKKSAGDKIKQVCENTTDSKKSAGDKTSQVSENSTDSKKSAGVKTSFIICKPFEDLSVDKVKSLIPVKDNKDLEDNKQLKDTKDNTSAKTELQNSENSTGFKKSASEKTSPIICKPFEDLSVDKLKSLNQISSSTDSTESAKPSEKPKRKRKVCKTKRKPSSISTKSNTESVTTMASDIQTAQDNLTPVKNNNISNEASVKEDLISISSNSSSISKSKSSDKSGLPCQIESKSISKPDSDSKSNTSSKIESKAKLNDDINIKCKLVQKPSEKSDKVEYKPSEKSDSGQKSSTQKTDTKLTDKSDECQLIGKSNLTGNVETKPSKNSDKIKLKPNEKSYFIQKIDIESDKSKPANNSNLSGKLEIKPSKKFDRSNKKEYTPSEKASSARQTEPKSTDKSSAESKPSDKTIILSKLDTKPSYKSDLSSKKESKFREENSELQVCDKEKSKVLSKENTNLKSESTCKTNANPTIVPASIKSDSTSKPADSKLSIKTDSTSKTHSGLAIKFPSNQSDSINEIDSKLTNEPIINKWSSKKGSKHNNLNPSGKIESKPSQKSNISRQTDSDIGTSQCELSIFRIITTRVCASNDSEGSQCSSKLTIENTNDKNSDNQVLLDADNRQKLDSVQADFPDCTNKKHLDSDKLVQSDSFSEKKSDSSSNIPITPETQFCNIIKGNSTTQNDLNVIKNVSKDSIECESKLSKCMRELKEIREKGRFCPPFEDLSSQKTKSVISLRDDSKTLDTPPKRSCTPSKKSSKSNKNDDKGEHKFLAPFEALDASKTKMCNPTSGKDDGGKFCPPFSELSREKVKSFSPVPKQNQSGERTKLGKNECVPVTRRKIETFTCPENQTVYTIITSMLCPSCDNHSTEKSSVKSSSSKESKKSDDNIPPTKTISTISPNKVDGSTKEDDKLICPPKPVEPPPKPENNSKPTPGSQNAKKAETNKSCASSKGSTGLEERGLKPADKFEQIKQNMLEAHCKTMSTIKVAAEDVFCTVAKKTIEMCGEDSDAIDNVRKSAEDLFNEVKNKTSDMCAGFPPERHPATVYSQICEKTKNLCKTTKDTVSGYFSNDEKCEPKPKTKTVSNSLPGNIKGFNLFNKFRNDSDEETEDDEGGEPSDTLVSALDTCTKELSERLSRLTFNIDETSSFYDNPTPKGSTPRTMSLSEMGVDMPESASVGMLSLIKEKIFSIFREKEEDKEILSIPSDHTLSIERDSKDDSDIDEADP